MSSIFLLDRPKWPKMIVAGRCDFCQGKFWQVMQKNKHKEFLYSPEPNQIQLLQVGKQTFVEEVYGWNVAWTQTFRNDGNILGMRNYNSGIDGGEREFFFSQRGNGFCIFIIGGMQALGSEDANLYLYQLINALKHLHQQEAKKINLRKVS